MQLEVNQITYPEILSLVMKLDKPSQVEIARNILENFSNEDENFELSGVEQNEIDLLVQKIESGESKLYSWGEIRSELI